MMRSFGNNTEAGTKMNAWRTECFNLYWNSHSGTETLTQDDQLVADELNVRPLCIALALRKHHVVLLGTALLAVSSVVQAQIPNSDIKAAFLYHFTQFVEWPALDAGGMFTICVAGDQATTIALRAWTRDKFVGSH